MEKPDKENNKKKKKKKKKTSVCAAESEEIKNLCMAIGGVLTHLGAQLGDVATTFADDGPGNLRARRVNGLKKFNSIF